MYMSPEQSESRIEDMDERSDIYSLGVLLYELASLERPYSAENVERLLLLISRGSARPLGEFAHHLSSSLISVIEKAMELEKKNRYQSIRELQDDIELVLDNLTPKAEKTHLVKRAMRIYLNHHKAFSRLKVMDVELMSFGSGLVGAALGVWMYSWMQGWGWALFLLGWISCIPFGISFWDMERIWKRK
jgi:serine/threonine protein kinase